MSRGFESTQCGQVSAVWKLGFAGFLAIMSVALLVVQIFPLENGPLSVVAAEVGLHTPAHRYPKGQLQADARTLFGALGYLIGSQRDGLRPIQTPGSSRAKQEARNFSGLPGSGIGLHQAEDVPLGVFAVRQPADSRDGHFGKRYRTTFSLCLPDGVVNGSGIHGANVSYHGSAIDLTSALDQTAVNARLAIGSSSDQPINLRAVPLFELPAEKVLVELDCPFGILRVNFEMDDSCHS